MKIADHMAYIAVCSHLGGPYLPERNVADLDRKSIIQAIADGQIDDVIQVLEINPVEKICRDVTEDIAWDVSALWAANGEPLNDSQRDFIEQHLGFTAANAFPRAA